MTTLTGRWWAPLRPTIEPDQVALALMKPDGNAQADFRAALLGVHRAGAASCEAVAKGAVPSEQGLLSALARTRAAIASSAVDTISKSLEPTYAGLLVRDVFDDAETAALTLFRTCVTKGVAPPIAASRVGAVFGVPSRELGTYAALAADPRANPVALTDAADRALLTYVEKLALDEVGEAKEEVSKAPGLIAQREDTRTDWEPQEHPRGARGRFVRAGTATKAPVEAEEAPTRPLTMLERLRQDLGLGTESAPDIVVAPEKAPARPRAERKTRKKRRTVHRVSVAPKVKQEVQAEQATAAAPKVKAKQLQATKLTAKQAKALDLAVHQVTAETAAAADVEGKHKTSSPLPADLLTLPSPNDTTVYGTIYEPIALHISLDEGQDLRVRASGPRHQKVLRLGWLLDHAYPPEVHGTEAAKDVREHAEQIELTRAEVVHDYAEPDVDSIHGDDLQMALYEGREKEYIQQRREELAGLLQEENLEGPNLREMANIIPVTDYHDGTLMLVHLKPHEGADPDKLRPRPTIEEFVIEDEAVGNVEFGRSGRHAQINLDPNQAYVVSSMSERLYDQKHSVFVNRWKLRPVDDEEAQRIAQEGRFGKALDTKERVEFEQEHPRDEVGRFTTTLARPSLVAPSGLAQTLLTQRGQETAQPVATGHKPSRRTRKMRTRVRRQQTTSTELQQRQQAPALEQTKVTARRAQAKKVTQQQAVQARIGMKRLARAAEETVKMPKLNELRDYHVMSQRDFNKLWTQHGWGQPQVSPTSSAILDGQGARQLHEADLHSGETVLPALRDQIGQKVWEQDEAHLKMIGERVIATDEDALEAVKWVDSVFDRDPRIAYIEVSPNFVGGSKDTPARAVSYIFEANQMPVQPVVLIEMDEDIDFDSNIELVHVGDYTSRQIVQVPSAPGASSIEESDRMLNVRVQFYRAKVTQYRAGRER